MNSYIANDIWQERVVAPFGSGPRNFDTASFF